MDWPSAGEGAAIIGIAVATLTLVATFVAFLRNLRRPPEEPAPRSETHDAVHHTTRETLRLVERVDRGVERIEEAISRWWRP